LVGEPVGEGYEGYEDSEDHKGRSSLARPTSSLIKIFRWFVTWYMLRHHLSLL
jgi:hypothetical protein